MNRADEIERAIKNPTPEEFARIANRVSRDRAGEGDAQMDRDAAEGRLDFLREEARFERQHGLLKDWAPAS